jgi:hypothetical protein
MSVNTWKAVNQWGVVSTTAPISRELIFAISIRSLVTRDVQFSLSIEEETEFTMDFNIPAQRIYLDFGRGSSKI